MSAIRARLGKKMELVKKPLLGTPAEQVFKLDAMVNADCVPWFVASRRSGHHPAEDLRRLHRARDAIELGRPAASPVSGMLRMPKRPATSGLASVSTLASSARS